jgi:methyl-accepting chemotaxis protein
MTGILTAIVFRGMYRSTVRNIKLSLENRMEREAHTMYGDIFAKIEVLTEEYAALVETFPLDDFAHLEKISTVVVAAQPIIVGGGYWLEYDTIPGKKYYGPYWYRDGSTIRLTWDYGNEANDYTLLDWYRNDGLASGQRVVWSELYNDSVTNVPMLTATSALVRDGRKEGVVTIDIGLAELTGYFKSITLPEIGRYSLSLLTSGGVCIVNSDPSLIGTQVYQDDLKSPQGGMYERDGHLLVYSPIAATGLVVAVDVETRELTAAVTASLIRNILLIILFVIFSIVLLMLFINHFISKPVTNTVATLRDVFGGDRTDLTRRLKTDSNDEIGEMAGYFNTALGKMNDLISAIQKEACRLSGIGEELSSNMNETAASVNQISANIQSVKKQTVNEAAGVAGTNATMQRITDSIGQLGSFIERQAASVTQSSSAIEQMLANISSVSRILVENAQNMEELTAASEKGRTDLSAVSASMRDVAKESEGLLQINGVIQSIASQTNLLAMNAAIEAAHAGESGKGFAVVSDEIRKLAESSGEQAKTVSAVLKKMKEAMTRTTGAADTVLRQFEDINERIRGITEREHGIRAAMDEQNEGSKSILESIGTLNEITSQVKSGSREMLAGSREVIVEGENLTRITGEVSGSMGEMAEGVVQITVAMNRINELSLTNKESIDILSGEVGKFTV